MRHLPMQVPRGVRVFARDSPQGNITYFQNLFYAPVSVRLPGPCIQTIAGGHLFPVISHFRMTPAFSLVLSCARIFGIFKQASTTVLIAYGPPGSTVLFRIGVKPEINFKSPAFTKSVSPPSTWTLRVKVPLRGPDIYSIKTRSAILRIFVESRRAMHHTWYVKISGRPALVCGPDYLGTATDVHGNIVLRTQTPLGRKVPGAGVYFADSSRPLLLQALAGKTPISASAVPPVLRHWQQRLADGPAMPRYKDKSWITAVNPVQMGVGDYPGLHEWYRTKFTVARAGRYQILFSNLRDTADVFINGRLVEAGRRREINVSLSAGINTLAVLAISHGRPKLWTYIGPYNSIASMGIWGRVVLSDPGLGAKPVQIRHWRMRGGIGAENSASGWQAFVTAPHVPTFYRTDFVYQPKPTLHLVLRVAWGKLHGGYMWVNGHNLGRYPDPFMRRGLYIPSCWLKNGKNSLVIFDERGNNPQSVHLVIEHAASRTYNTLQMKPAH